MNIALLKSDEGKILLVGSSLLALFTLLLLFCAFFKIDLIQPLLNITATNIIFGRMAGLSIGIAAQMDAVSLILFSLFIESIMVLIAYPLFVLSWNKLEIIDYAPLNNFLERSKKNANTYQPLIQRYGIIGLVLFVLTPFAMTGPVVGSFVGYLMGLTHKKTLFFVLLSTFIAIILWFYLMS